MLEPAHIIGLPKGQCFALMEGGNLWKIRLPLPANDPDEVMPASLQELAAKMRKSYEVGQANGSEWWEAPGQRHVADDLPLDLQDDFKKMTQGSEDAA